MSSFTTADTADTAVSSVSLYRAIWRWRFFASFLSAQPGRHGLSLPVQGRDQPYRIRVTLSRYALGSAPFAAKASRCRSRRRSGINGDLLQGPASLEQSAIVGVS